MRAIIYARLSAKPDDPDNYPQQVADCHAVADDLGWDVVEVIEEPPATAFEDGPQRPGFTRLRRMLDADEADAVIARDAERLARNLSDFGDLVRRRDFRLAYTDGSVKWARDAAEDFVAARRESRLKSRRGQSGERRRVERGAPPRGGRRHFGYHSGTDKCGCGTDCEPHAVREDEAAIVREVAARWLAGETMSALVRDLNDRGVRTTSGNRWGVTRLKRTLQSRRIAGIRVHKGVEVEGAWEAILPRDVHHRLLAANTRSGDQRAPVAYLLRGVIQCGVCDSPMQGHRHSNARRRYRCPECSNGISADPVDRLVWAAALGRTWQRDRESEARAEQRLRDVEARRREMQAAREELDDSYWQHRSVPRSTYDTQAAKLDATLADLAREAQRLTEARSEAASFWGSLQRLTAAYEQTDWDAQRALIRGAVEAVTIERTGAASTRYPVDSAGDPITVEGVHFNVRLERVGVNWRR